MNKNNLVGCNNIKNDLLLYLPNLFEIIGTEDDFGWNKIDSLYNKIKQKRIDLYGGQTIDISPTIFDRINAAKENDPIAILQLNIINDIFLDLSSSLNDHEKQLLKSNIKNILKSDNNNWRNFFGEIAVINNILQTNLYELIGIEKRSNGKPIDFLIKEKYTGEISIVEVVSIHLDTKKVESNIESIKKFITYRINQKFNSKSCEDSKSNFYLIPILWGDTK